MGITAGGLEQGLEAPEGEDLGMEPGVDTGAQAMPTAAEPAAPTGMPPV